MKFSDINHYLSSEHILFFAKDTNFAYYNGDSRHVRWMLCKNATYEIKVPTPIIRITPEETIKEPTPIKEKTPTPKIPTPTPPTEKSPTPIERSPTPFPTPEEPIPIPTRTPTPPGTPLPVEEAPQEIEFYPENEPFP